MSKADFTRKARSQAVSIDIKDSEGGLLRTISFNPRDARDAKVFAEMSIKINNIQNLLQGNDKESETKPGQIIEVVNALDDIFADLDKIFGAGTTDLLTYGVIDEESLESLMGFLAIVTPYYQQAAEDRADKLKPYIDK